MKSVFCFQRPPQGVEGQIVYSNLIGDLLEIHPNIFAQGFPLRVDEELRCFWLAWTILTNELEILDESLLITRRKDNNILRDSHLA